MASPIITIVTPGDLSDDEDEPVPIQDFPLDKVFHTVADYMHEIPLCTIFHEIACCNPARGANVTFQVHPPKGPVFKGVYLGFTLGETPYSGSREDFKDIDSHSEINATRQPDVFAVGYQQGDLEELGTGYGR
ncbi:hypothetical protein FRC04_006605 [Tulasnella sp. 424]|nr:hypothetical protein FRC04_006605 [Tulasnella sp. 424]KAG8960945.1 hypothetical protein FRC05_006437 [Tulasnella sp. 425]